MFLLNRALEGEGQSYKYHQELSTKKRLNNVTHGTKAFGKEEEVPTIGLQVVLEKAMRDACHRFLCSCHITVSISSLLEATLWDTKA
ncbi:hypothetical protein llap_10332 [Limosa lapponica baueri]|uniref:Uncharacterized protein n=1 Tax=Limosa lapponica baueri TaxID=1758121 RepID=A0A2I0U011_LIMLA|nr:hypothetical protein llap_10332 [Limosa lapponica baueri]